MKETATQKLFNIINTDVHLWGSLINLFTKFKVSIVKTVVLKHTTLPIDEENANNYKERQFMV